MSSDSIKAAMFANASIAAAKSVGAVVTGSASMMAEAIHSFSDCGNQLLLMWGLKTSKKEADINHPLGYGMNVYFWSFIVALVLFSIGGVYSVYESIHKILNPEPLNNVQWAIGILLFGVVMEGRSFLICIKEIKALHPGKSFQWFFKETRSPELLVIFAEDLAALIGLVIALFFVTLAWVTGNPIFDAIGSLFVGTLLIAVAIFLFLEIKALMIGQSVDPLVRRALREHIFHNCEQIEHTYECTTLQMGKEAVLLLRVRLVETEDAKVIIDSISEIEKSISSKFPQFTTIFIEPANTFEEF